MKKRSEDYIDSFFISYLLFVIACMYINDEKKDSFLFFYLIFSVWSCPFPKLKVCVEKDPSSSPN